MQVTAESASIVIPGIAPDGSLFPIGKLEAHQRGTLHVAVSVFVFSGENLLIQRRAAGKYHCGLTWANTCCTHPHWGERVEDAANRRLKEELGIAVELQPANIFSYTVDVTRGLIENERVHIFRGETDQHSLTLTLNPAEVADTEWVPLEELRKRVAAEPSEFAPWFHIYVSRWPDLGLA